MKVVRTVLHKAAQNSAFNQWRDFFGVSTTILSLHLCARKYACWYSTAANRLSPKNWQVPGKRGTVHVDLAQGNYGHFSGYATYQELTGAEQLVLVSNLVRAGQLAAL
jgi:hypothetical protein